MVLCVAFGCNNRSERNKDVSYHSFPKDEALKSQWILRLNRGETATKPFQPSASHKICSHHFTPDCFTKSQDLNDSIGFTASFRPRLKDDAIPTIFVSARPEKRPRERDSTRRVREKKLKAEVRSSFKSLKSFVAKKTDNIPGEEPIPVPGTGDFFDAGPFVAEPLTCAISATFTTTSVTTMTTTTVTTTSVTTMSTVSTTSSFVHTSNPLMWFANLAGTLPVFDTSTAPSYEEKNNKTVKTSKCAGHNHDNTVLSSQNTVTCKDKNPGKKSFETKKETFSIQTQTPQNLLARRHVAIQNVRKMVDKDTQTPRSRLQIPARESKADQSLNDSILSVCSDDIDRDPDWHPEHDLSDCETSEDNRQDNEPNEAQERKFIVFESCLDQLLEKCNNCGSNREMTKKTMGTCVKVDGTCLGCGEKLSWCSQPLSGQMPLGNLLLSAAVMFCGASPVKCLRALDFAGIENISLSTYMNIQTSYLTPTILDVWKRHRDISVETIERTGRNVRLAGDARCCTPGHTAKFASYSMLDLETGKILDFKLVQVNEVKNSYAMELEGLRRSLAYLTEERSVTVTDLITDRHSSVKKFMKEQRPDIKHWFDVWHVAKGIYKKLEAASKKKGCEKVKEWARSISNHLYWCAASSNGDGELVKQKWMYILNHVANVHDGHGDRFSQCEHGQLESRNWMIAGRKPHSELEKIVMGRLLLNDIKKLSPSDQTSSLESFHNIVCNYAAKSVHYFHAQMEARIALAALHFNENSNRPQAVTKEGHLQYSLSFPKARKGDAVAKEVKVQQTFNYIDELMGEVLLNRAINTSYRTARENNCQINQQRPPPIAQSTPARPDKTAVVRAHVSRFNRRVPEKVTEG